MSLGNLFQQVVGAITHHANEQQHTGFDAGGLLSQVQDLFGQHAANTGQDIRPASQDPYGDPADNVNYGNIKPASQDPLGDPADDADRARGIRPASEDPLGDPADRAA
jgi:hypothetical protein